MTPQRLLPASPVTHPLTGPVTTLTPDHYRHNTGPFRQIRHTTVWGISHDIFSTQQGKTRRRR
jgi:hypothetical protein